MKIDISSGEICLADNHPVSLRGARGLRVECIAGTIWITVAGQSGDIFLTTGQSYLVQGNGLTLVESIGSGSIRIGKPAGLTSFRRRLATLRALLRPRPGSGLVVS